VIELLLAAATLQVDDVIAVVGSICVVLAALALVLVIFVVLKNRGHRPERALEGPALPPVGWTAPSASIIRGVSPEIAVKLKDGVSDTDGMTQKATDIRRGED
jgi:hypothetical protein